MINISILIFFLWGAIGPIYKLLRLLLRISQVSSVLLLNISQLMSSVLFSINVSVNCDKSSVELSN